MRDPSLPQTQGSSSGAAPTHYWWQTGWASSYTPPRHPSSTPAKPAGGSTSTTPSSGAPAPTGSSFTSSQQSAFDYMSSLLANYGLGDLAGTLKTLILNGTTDPDELQLQLQQTDAWKTRFAGNEMLRQKGLPVLSVADYLSTERSYAQVMKNYGLPSGFYDDPADFAQWIGNSVSPNEVNQRAQMYSDLANREDPAVQNQLLSMGLSKGDLLAYMMDPTRAQPLLQHKYQTALIGAAARDTGLVSSNPDLLAEQGITEAQARSGFGQIAQQLPTLSKLGDIYNDQIGESDLEASTFEGDAAAQQKQNRLASQERAAFNGSAGTNDGARLRSAGGLF